MRRLSLLALALLLSACGKGDPTTPPTGVLPDGGRYQGEVVDGLLQGQGRLDYPNGTHYQGSFKDGLMDGLGTLKRKDGDRYQGEFKAGLFHGIGRLERADGSSFEGSLRRGEPRGYGTTTDKHGNQLSGTFKNGKLNGEGSYKGAEGDTYVGNYQDSVFHGKGRYQSPDGDVWIGQFSKGRATGAGEFTGADGSHYQGQFKYWLYDGQGLLTLPDGGRYQGQFTDGQYEGTGTLTLADGSVQTGTWQAGKRVRDGDGKRLPDPLEVGLLNQGALLEQALAAVPPSTPAVELYSLTLAGDGEQSVFLREADYVSTLLHDRFAAHGQVTLVNHRDHLLDRPLATRENLRRAVQTLAERSGAEDMVFIYLTSHGSHDHQLSLVQPGLELSDMPAAELAELLLPLKSHYKVVVISACFAGGFIPELKDDKTLVMAAARSDRTSFGCSDEADFTYFGRALFAEALNNTDDLERAFEQAKASVAKREQEDDFEPSEPQIWAPRTVLAHWQAMRKSQAATH